MSKKNSKTLTLTNAFHEYSNPLRGLTRPGIEHMLECAKKGNDARLQIAFAEMERNTPIFGICISKRISAVLERSWDILPMDDSEFSKKQAEAVKKTFMECESRNEDGLTEAIRHLCLATFRGRSIVKPYIHDNGELILKPMNNWHVLDLAGKLYFNPKADLCLNPAREADIAPDKLIELPKDEVVCVREERPIDIPGLMVSLRQLVGEEEWARFQEQQPGVVITAPEGTPDTALGIWTERALRIYEGGSGVLPPGAKLDILNQTRGSDGCFSEYCQHQMEVIVLLACGGTLGTLPGSTGLGSNVAEVQESNFQSLVSYDCKRISNAITNIVVSKICDFMGEERLCRFTFTEKDKISASEYLDYAIKAKNAGLGIDIEKLRERTGLDFLIQPETPAPEGSETWNP